MNSDRTSIDEHSTTNVCGVWFSALGLDSTVGLLADWSTRPTERVRWFACVNPHSMELARRDSEFARAIGEADLVTADGIGIVLASRILGGTIRERVCGPDLFPMLCERLNQDHKGIRMFFLGTNDENLAVLTKRISVIYSNLVIAGCYAPPYRTVFSEEENREIIERVNAGAADILWIGLGAPKQEKWAAENRHRLNVKLIGPVGGVFDFFTGRVKLPPRWMQRLGLIWLFRLVQEPGRLWRRNWDGFVFLGRIILHRAYWGRGPRSP
jgi:N-acetylglucosaminyldiphosphoundecaprenol N-acetyl-beta-D-mannosaminyltransferase